MTRVTIPNGLIIFDIQNRNNTECVKNYNRMVLEKNGGYRKLFRYSKNILKILLRNGAQNGWEIGAQKMSFTAKNSLKCW